jgi:hypothetical protein
MKMLRRCVLAAALSLTAAVGGLLVAGTAHAQTVTTGSLSFSGDAGDYISQGKSSSYSSSKGDALDVSSATGGTVSISVNAYNGDWWTLDFDAPGTPDRPVPGQPSVLAPGTYTGAHRYPFNGNGPGLSLSGEGRGCNQLTGSFTIIKAVFGPQGYVQTFDATFEQHCEGGTPAARGEVHIANPPSPAGAAPLPTARPTAKPTAGASSTQPGVPNHDTTLSTQPSITTTPRTARAESSSFENAVRAPLLLVGAGVVVWVVLVVVGLVVGLVMPARRR